MKVADFRSLLRFQTELQYTRQSGVLVDGYIQKVLTSGTFYGFEIPNYYTEMFRDTDANFVLRSDRLLITKDSLEINDIIGEYKIIEDAKVLDLFGLNLYGLKRLV